MHVNVRACVRACVHAYVRQSSCDPFMRPQEGGPGLKIARVSNTNNVPVFLGCIVGVQ